MADDLLEGWQAVLDQLGTGAINFTVGLIGGSRECNDRRAVDRLASAALAGAAGKGLLVRVNSEVEIVPRRSLRAAKTVEAGPPLTPSPQGPWKETVVAMRLGLTAPPNLERLPRWLSKWKRDFSRIVIDLGAINLPVCRTIGRYCDTSFLLLGPNACAGSQWLRDQLDILSNCHVAVAGSLLITTDADAEAA